VILPTQIVETKQIVDTKRALDELKASVDYPLEGWRKLNFAHSTVLMQEGPTHCASHVCVGETIPASATGLSLPL